MATAELQHLAPRPRLKLRGQYIIPIIGVGLVLALVLVPLATMILFSFRSGTPWNPGPFTLNNYVAAYSDRQTYEIFLNTAFIAFGSTIISAVIAIFFAFLTERTDMPFRNLAWGLMLVPMAMPGLLFAVSWTFLLSPNIGMFNVWMRSIAGLFGITIERGPLNIYSIGGMIFLEGMRGVTTTFLIIVGAFRAMDPSLEEAARASGASNWTTLRRIFLPLLTPALLAAFMYSLMTHLESLEIPLVIGLPAKVFVFPSFIFFTTQRFTPPQYGLAAALGATFLVISIILVFWYRGVVRRGNRYATITGKGYRPRIIHLGKWRYVFFGGFVVYFLITIGAPAVSLMWSSLLPIPMPPSLDLIGTLSFRNYERLFSGGSILQATFNTIWVAFGTGTLTMTLSLIVAWVVIRHRVAGGGVLDTISFLPHALPGVIIGIAFIFLFLQPPLNQLRLLGTDTIIILGMTVSYIAFGSRTMNGAVAQIHAEMEEAAVASGAKWRVVMQRIVLPLLLPAFIGGWIWVVTHALRNFSIPLILASRDNKLLSVIMWQSWDDGKPGQTAALGVLMIIALAFITIGGRMLVSRLSKQQT